MASRFKSLNNLLTWCRTLADSNLYFGGLVTKKQISNAWFRYIRSWRTASLINRLIWFLQGAFPTFFFNGDWKTAGLSLCHLVFDANWSQRLIDTMFEDFPDCASGTQPEFFRESISLTHALRRFLPLARRRLITLRPPGVDIRARNPCFFLRRRLFGWKVRFIV